MASGNWTFSTTNDYITGRVRWSSVSNGSAENSSKVTVYLDYKKSSSSSSKTYGTLKGNIYINGTPYGYSKSVTLSCNNTYQNVASETVTISHNSDGTKSITIDATGGISGTTFTSSSCPQKTVTLDKIPRYATITTWSKSSVTQRTVTFNWKTDSTCSGIRYAIGSGSWSSITSVDASSGTLTVSGLDPNTSYTIKLDVRRKDSGLWSSANSGTKSATIKTNPIVTISTLPAVFNIGNDITVGFANAGANNSTLTVCMENVDGTWSSSIYSLSVTSGTSSTTLDLSSVASKLYANSTTRNSLRIRIACSATISGKTYTNYYYSNATVTNSNPTFSDFTCADISTTTQNVLSNTAYMFEGYGNMKVTIANGNAVALNSATIKSFSLKVYNANSVVVYDATLTYANATINKELGSFSSAGTYTIKIYAVDSRGNTSSVVSKNFYVLPYKKPTVKTLALKRVNDFEKEVHIDYLSLVSKLTIGEQDKNNSFTLKYRYKKLEDADSAYTSYTFISDIISTSSSTTEYSKKYSTTDTNYFMEIPIDESLVFQFVSTDKVTSYTSTIIVDRGTPIFSVSDNNIVTVDAVPDPTNTAPLQVGGDISAIDDDGIQHYLLEDLASLENDITTLNSGLETTNNNLSASNSNITKLQTSINTINTNITTLTNKIKNMLCTSYSLTATATAGTNWTISDCSAVLVGCNLRIYFTGTRSSSVSGNITNEEICTLTINTDNRISGTYSIHFNSGTTGAVSSLSGSAVSLSGSTLKIKITLAATGGSTTSLNGYGVIPVRLNYNYY